MNINKKVIKNKKSNNSLENNTNKYLIIGIKVKNRNHKSQRLQKLLTEYAHCIKTRLGLHDIDKNKKSIKAIIIIEFIGTNIDTKSFKSKLKNIDEVEIQEMNFKS